MTPHASWQNLIAEVPREPFIPDTIWVDVDPDRPRNGLVAVSKHDDPQRWYSAVAANDAVVTQVDDGRTAPGETGWTPTSSGSMPLIVAKMLDALDVGPDHSVLEIGTGTGWNAALLCRRVGSLGQVVSIEIDSVIADTARAALAGAGYSPLVITGDGVDGYPDAAPYDRVLATASVREAVPRAWLAQTCQGGLIVTPWGTDYCNGVMLTLRVSADGTATGCFGEDLAFMRLRSQRRHFYEPDDAKIRDADTSTTDVHGMDYFRMVNSDEAAFAIGLRVPNCALTVKHKKFGDHHHVVELSDATTGSWAQWDAHLTSPDKLVVRQLGPRRLWDEAVAAYDWWYDNDEPTLSRFGMTVTADSQTVWLDEPDNVVRVLA